MPDNKEYLIQNNDAGSVLISDEVICTIAAAAVLEVEGVDSLLPNIGSDLVEKLGIKAQGRGIKLTVDADSIALDCTVTLNYGYEVVEVAHNIQQNVSNAISSMTGFRVERVDVNVSGIVLPKKR